MKIRGFILSVMGVILICFGINATSAYAQDRNWSDPINISNTYSDSVTPSITADPSGIVHLVWVENSVDAPPAILYTSVEEGHINPPNDIFSSGWISQISSPELVCDSEGNLHIAYLANGIVFSSAFAPLASSAQSWKSPQVLVQKANYTTSPSLALGPGDAIYIVYAITVGSKSGIFIITSENGGEDWTEPDHVYQNTDRNRFVDDPQITIDNEGKIHVVWMESNFPETFPPLGIRYSNSVDSINWIDPISLADGPYDDPGIHTRAEDEIHVVWSGTTEDRYKFHRWSVDGGDIWHPLWRNLDLGGFQGSPALVEDSSNRLYWLQIGTVFNLSQDNNFINDSLYLNVYSNGDWSPGNVLLRGSITEQNLRDVSAAVSLGNEIHMVVSNPLPKTGGNYQFDIIYLTSQIYSPLISPLSLVVPQTISTLTSIPQHHSSPTKTPFLISTSETNGETSPLTSISVSVLSSGILLLIFLIVNLNRKRGK